jgi:uracil-DNA glycosylase family 4
MSDSQNATDIVHSALQTLHEQGVHFHASNEVLARLAETAGQKSAPSPTRAAPQHDDTRPKHDLRAAFQAQMNTTPAAVPAPASRASARAALPFTEVANATTLAPATGAKAERLAAMRGPVLACTKCPHLVKTRTQVVFGTGNPDAELMFVGEAPGAYEDIVGEPFVGKAGQLLTKIIETMNLSRSDVYIANVLKCRPDTPPGEAGNRKPSTQEMQTCKPYLLEQINIIQPRVIVALGGTAVEGLLNIEKAGITRMRGQWQDFHGIPLMPTFHPSYLLRNQSLVEKRHVWEDMLAVLEKLDHPISAKQHAFFLPRS